MDTEWYDAWIQEFLYFNLKRPPFIDLPRDVVLEKKIALASKIEYILETMLQQWSDYCPLGGDLQKLLQEQREIFFPAEDAQKTPLTRKRGPAGTPLPKLLGMKTMKVPGVPTAPLFEAYCKQENHEPADALRILATTLKKELEELCRNDATLPDTISRCTPPWSLPSATRCMNYVDGEGFSDRLLHVLRAEGGQIVIPSIRFKGFHEMTFAFMRGKEKTPFLNQRALERYPDAIAILTDSLDLANINEQEAKSRDYWNVLWISWCGGIEALGDLNWQVIANRRVYYILAEHSGFAKKDIISTARAVNYEFSKLPGASLKFVSYLHDPPPKISESVGRPVSPLILDTKHALQVPGQPIIDPPSALGLLVASHQIVPHPHRFLLRPLLRERSLTVVYGDKGVGKTWFCLSIALMLSQDKNLFGEGWSVETRAPVLYAHCEQANISLAEKLDTVWRMCLRGTDDVPEHYCPAMDHLPSGGTSFLSQPMPFPVVREETLSSHTPGNPTGSFFHWLPVTASFDATKPDFRALSWERYVPIFAADRSSSGGVIVLDGMRSFAELEKPGRNLSFNAFVQDMKSRGHAVIVVLPSERMSDSGAQAIARKIGSDSRIRVRYRESTAAEKIAMTITVEKAFRLPKSSPKKFVFELDPDSENPRWCSLTVKRSIEWEILQVIELWIDTGLTGAVIAEMLGITHSVEKLRRRQIRDAFTKGSMHETRRQFILKELNSRQITSREMIPQMIGWKSMR